MKRTIARLVAAFLATAVVCILSSGTRAATYTFETLSLSALGGQDGWNNYSGNFVVSAPFGGAPGNTSFRDAQGLSSDNRASRNNDPNFTFSHTGTETAAILQLDFRLGNSDADQQVAFGVGRDANADGVKAGAGPSPAREIGTAFGATWAFTTPAFYIFQNGATTFSPFPASVFFPAGVDGTDWIRLKMVMDLTANGGDGAGSLYYMDLTDGDTGFTAVAGLQNFNLTLLSGPAASTWNAVYMEGGTDSQLDNLLVPEPHVAAALVGLPVLGLLRRRPRHKMSSC